MDDLNPTALRAEGAAAERKRIRGILAAPEAKGREPQAQHIALETGMDVTSAATLLASFPAARKVGDSHFARAMAATPNPEVGAVEEVEPVEPSPVDRLLAARAAATGRKPNTRKA